MNINVDAPLLTTIEAHILEEQHLHPDATGDFTNLLYDIALAAKLISREVNRAGLANILGMTGDKNVQGEEVQKLDVFANNALIRACRHAGRVAIMVTEESPEPVYGREGMGCGRYAVAFDPLDGSSNIDVNVSIGTIFAIYSRSSPPDTCGTIDDLLQHRSKLEAGGYVLYGASTMFVYTSGHGVHGFTLEPSLGEFVLSHPNMRMPKQAQYYSINEGHHATWPEGVRKYVEAVKSHDPARGRPYSSRYIGSFVSDFHRNLLKGGIYLYPPDKKRPGGKLRLLYEGIPMAFIAEQAGGKASDGHRPILDIEPTSIHQRVPIYIGCADEVDEVEGYIRKYG